jgi:hypothetical protein
MRYALFALPLLAAQPAFAETAEPDIIVTGQGLAPSAGDAAYDIAVIPRARLAESASGRAISSFIAQTIFRGRPIMSR